MNPLDALNDEERFTLLLARYNEVLSEGDDAEPLDDSALSPQLRQRLQRTLDCLRRLRRFQARPCQAGKPDLRMPSPEKAVTLVLAGGITLHDEAASGQVGRFQIRRTLGHGGGGIVFLAFDPDLRREVAVKVPHLAALLTPETRRRFLREARAAASLDHPNLVPVYEVGEANGLCFLVSAYCRGGSLAEWLAAPVPIRQAAELVAVLADAVQYVHEHGIYHRDIKPGNVLLDSKDQKVPSGGLTPPECANARGADAPRSGNWPCELPFVPRLTDFGLAKLHDAQTEATRSGALLGTPSYMAPEQIEGRLRDIGPATDVYGLGAVLYEMLAGQPPFKGATDTDTLRRVLAEEPAPPHRLRPNVPRDLETICVKCLEKEPARRYASAAELADDLRHFLAHEPIQARPRRRIERLRKWVRRRPAKIVLFASAFLIGLVLLAGWLRLASMERVHDADQAAAAKQDGERQDSIRQEGQRLRRHRYAENIALTWRDWGHRRLDDMVTQLESHRPSPDEANTDDLRGFEWYYLSRLTGTLRRRMRHSESLYCAAFSPDGTTCASGHSDGTIRLWDAASGQLRRILNGHKFAVLALAYSSNGKYLASGSGSAVEGNIQGEVLLWNARTQKWPYVFSEPLGAVDSLAFSPDGLSLAAATKRGGKAGGEVKVWAIPSGMPRADIAFADSGGVAVDFSSDKTTRALGHFSMAFSADSATLAVGHADGRMSLCDALRGRRFESWPGHQRCVWSVAGGRKNAVFASGGHDGRVRLWSVRPTRRLLGEYRHDTEVWGVAVSPDDRTVASVNRDGVVKLWDAEDHRERVLFKLPQGWGRVVLFSPNGKTLAVGSEDGRLWICDVSWSTEPLSWLGHKDGKEPREAWAVAFSPDNKILASAGDDHMIRLWDPASGRERAVLRGHQSLVTSLAFSPDGKWLASGSFDEEGPVKLWQTASGKEIATLNGHNNRVDALVFSPDGKLLATAGRDCVVRLWDVAARKDRPILSGHKIESLAFSPDGRTLALASTAQAVFLWDIEEEKLRRTQLPLPSGHVAVAFSPDGKTLASGDSQGAIRLWDAATGQLRVNAGHHEGVVNCLAFAPDSKTLASASFNKKVKLWQTTTGRELLTLPEQKDRVRWLAFSADCAMLATAAHDGILKIYRAADRGK